MRELVLGVLASGRGSNLQAILDSIKSGYLPAKVGVVISDKPEAYALSRAVSAGIPSVCIERKNYSSKQEFEDAITAQLVQHGVNLVVLAGFMRILGAQFIHKFNGKIMNIHPSLLPAFPGLDAQAQAINYGVKVAGCTVHFIDEGMDTGPIILQQAVEVLEDDTPQSLAERIIKIEHQLYPRAIKLYAEGRLQINGRRVHILPGTE